MRESAPTRQAFSDTPNTPAIHLDGTVLRMLIEQPRHAAQWILAAAERGVVDAQAMLGQILLEGRGIEADPILALHWFRHAAGQGHLTALNMVGRCLENGWGCDIDFAEAADCYRQAAVAGLDWGQYNFANLLSKGLGVEQDLSAAFHWYRQAAEQGHAKAMNLVGRFYEEGWIFPADPDRAVHWYRRSAQGGDFRGQCSYASVLTRQGEVDEAVHWLRLAMRTATHGFKRKMAQVLIVSTHTVLQSLGGELLAQCSDEGDAEDWLAYAHWLLRQSDSHAQEQAHRLLQQAAMTESA